METVSDINITKLSKELRLSASRLSTAEVRYLVDAYYQMQDDRIRANNQVRQITKDEPLPPLVTWLAEQCETLESQIKGALDVYVKSKPVGCWLLSITGIGPVISAGLLAHIDIEKAPTVGHIWRFAGLDPTVKWEKKQKRPWNARLKVICWKAGESFVKVSNNDKAFYGHVYKERKALETSRNEQGLFRDQASAALEAKKIGKETEAYKSYSSGRLPPAHIHARATRYAVKLFLSHLHEEMYRERYGIDPPLPYPIAHLGHAHKVNAA